MQDMNLDNKGITYGLIYIFAGLILIGGIWIIGGVIVDEFNFLSNDLTLDSEIWTYKTQNNIGELNKIWELVLWIMVIASLIYGTITAIRKEGRGIDG